MDKTIALIVAGGTSRRFGGEIPKQYCMLHGKMVLRHTVEVFENHPLIAETCVVIHPDHRTYYNNAIEGLALPAPILGGNERYESVYNGLKQYEHSDITNILIHDAARPFISQDIITQHVEALTTEQATLTAINATDTIKQQTNQTLKTLDRNHIFLAQTPQGFQYDLLLKRYENHMNDTSKRLITDDVSLFEDKDDAIKIINGSRFNIKITTQEDLEMGEYLWSKR